MPASQPSLSSGRACRDCLPWWTRARWTPSLSRSWIASRAPWWTWELLKRFERRGVSLVSVADALDTRSAAGRLVLNIMVSVSQWEREAIGERTRDAMRHKRANGERVGTVPFGYRPAADGVRLEADDMEQGILSRIRDLSANGLTTRQIAADLNRRWLTTRRGTAWRFQYVAHMLRFGRDCRRLPAAA